MSERVSITVDGVRELNRLLRLAGGRELQKQLAAVNKRIGDMVIARARPLAPIASGDLVRSLRASNSSWAAKIRGGNRRRVPYGPIVHWGSRYRPDTPAQPFVAQARDSLTDRIVSEYLGGVERIIRTISDK